MKNLNVSVANKVATYCQRDGFIVCGNSDYRITFAFDSEWSEYTAKTARFKWNNTYIDVVFEGDIVNVPIIQGASQVEVGVFAGELHTTTPAVIPCVKSILCDDGVPLEPTPDVYAQLMNIIYEKKYYHYKMAVIPKGGKFTLAPEMLALVLPYGEYTLSTHKSDGTTIVENMGTSMIFSSERSDEWDSDFWMAMLYAKKATLTVTVSSNHNRYSEDCYIQNNYSGSEGSGNAYVYYLT